MDITRIIVGDLATNCYILKSSNDLCVIDPGGDSALIINSVKESKAKLKYIINTHYHDDHVIENAKVKRSCGGEILIHKAEEAFVDFEIDRYINTNDVITFGETKLSVIHTPGHSSGSVCLMDSNNIFTGDTLFLNGCGRVDLLGGSEKDLEESLLKLSRIIMPGMVVYPGHGESYLMEK